MKSLVSFIFILSIWGGLLSVSGIAKPKAPEWLTRAAEEPDPEFKAGNRPEAVVLLDEAIYDFSEDGTLFSTYRYAIRVIEPRGKERASVKAYYRDGSIKIHSIKAWNIDREGEVYAFKNRDVEDVSASGSSLYSENRAKRISGESKSRVGSVFGYEYTKEEKSLFSQYIWSFQNKIPVVRSRLEVRVPDGWGVRDTRFHEAPSPRKEENVYVWEMMDIGKYKTETGAPYRSIKRSFMTIDVEPPEGVETRHTNLTFSTWEDISNYTAKTQDPQMKPTPEIEAKARELTTDADDVWSKVKAIGDYVKDLRYASINMDLSNGGGYKPREASEVFRVGYGDCKD